MARCDEPVPALARVGRRCGLRTRHVGWLGAIARRATERVDRDLGAAARVGCDLEAVQAKTGPEHRRIVRVNDASVPHGPFTRKCKVHRVRALTPKFSCKRIK